MVTSESEDQVASNDPDEFKVVPDTVRNRAYKKLRHAIVTGYFLPGQRLIERELCEKTGVSRTSIREALRVLEAERLIVIAPYRGPSVASLTLEEASQIYEVRRLLEGLAATRAAELATNAEIEALESAVLSFEDAVEAQDLHRLVALASTYYEILLRASRNEVATNLLSSLNARTSLLRATSMADPKRTKHSAAEMRRIMEAIRARDPGAALVASNIHVSNAAAAAREHLLNPTKADHRGDSASKRSDGTRSGRESRAPVLSPAKTSEKMDYGT